MPKTRKLYLMPPYLTLSIIKYRSRVSGAIQQKHLRPPLHHDVLAIEKGTRFLSTTVGQHIYIYVCVCVCVCVCACGWAAVLHLSVFD